MQGLPAHGGGLAIKQTLEFAWRTGCSNPETIRNGASKMGVVMTLRKAPVARL